MVLATSTEPPRQKVVRIVTNARNWPDVRGLEEDAHLTMREAVALFGETQFSLPMTVAAAVELLESRS
jgi:hypothetical protein